MPTISLKTVYQTVHDLESMGEVALLDLGTGSVRVDPNVEHPHHHLVCTRCEKVRDVVVDVAALRLSPTSASRLLRRRRRGAVPRRLRRVRSHDTLTQRPIQTTANDHKEQSTMPDLKGSKTEDNLKEAFAGESQANRRYLYFAQKADVEGYPDVAALFRSVAEGETGHAFGHFDFLAEVGDPVTGVPVGATSDNLKSAIAGETYEYTEMYPGFSKTARDEGFDEIAEWLETLARAEKSHAGRFTQGLESV